MNDPELAAHCRSLRNLCFRPEKRFVHDRLGWNFRMTNLQAAVGLAQLENLDSAIEKKRSIGRLYNDLLKDIPMLQLPLKKTDYATNIYWVFSLVLDENCNLDANGMIKKLSTRGIGCRPFFFPMHNQPVFKKMGLFRQARLPNSEKLYEKGFYIPSGLGIKENEIAEVARAVRESLYE